MLLSLYNSANCRGQDYRKVEEPVDISIILSFFGFTAMVAVISYWKTRHDKHDTADAYFLGGRSLTAGVIAGSLMLTNLSTEQLIGLNGVSFREGFVAMAWETLAAITLVILALFYLPRYLSRGLTTIPEFLEQRYDRTTRTMVNILFLSGYVTILLPVVLYSGAVGISGIFKLEQLTGLSHIQIIWLTVWSIGVLGSVYAVFGGLRAVAVSDTINGIGLLAGGIMIPVFGLLSVGNGSLLKGVETIYAKNPDMFNAIGSNEHSVPFATIFTGMMLVNMFYWCTNQVIVQRALAAENLKEGQKGVLLAGFLKLLGPIILVLPGVVAFHLFDGQLGAGADAAYPKLVNAVLPAPLVGFFGAVLLGAILSSFNSALNSASTLFSVGLYKPYINPGANDRRVVLSGKLFGAAIAVISMSVAPLIMYADQGVFGHLQEVNGCYSIPILTIIIVGMFSKRVPPLAAKFGLVFGVGCYVLSQFVLKVDLHFLHVMAILFIINSTAMLIIGRLYPLEKPFVWQKVKTVDLGRWHLAPPVGILICGLSVTNYVLFSQAKSFWPIPVAVTGVAATLAILSKKKFRKAPTTVGTASEA